ncbi:MAG TPA: 3'(2'),5'-bisphosphate nucleotidase CysQ [Steroidobacteraceae bacterium]|nr:3'(2'),5'-bisphosphate nucleotidase CysQ [Steroidobacteraceae bacterium]
MSETPLLEALIDAALEGGRAVRQIYRRGFAVHRKEDATPVTDADHASEAIIIAHLARTAPSIPVVAEEAVAAGRTPAIGAEFFLVDPLDGTREFVARRGEFTVNIALVRAGAPVLGVVYAPECGANGLLYAGDATSGVAFRGEPQADGRLVAREPIRVRTVPRSGLTAVASRSHGSRETDVYLDRYAVSERVSIGSSLKFCLLAEGKADLYPRLGTTMEWDTAAGHAVLAAAGGSVIAPDGKPLAYGKTGFRNTWFIASGSLVPLPIAA